jgi:DNA polymerase-3 subunit beta
MTGEDLVELTASKKDLLKLVNRMQAVAEKKSTMQVLSNVLLAAEGNGTLRLAATDLYLGLLGRIEAGIGKGGSVAVPAKDLFERIKNMPDGPIAITTQDNGQTTLKAQGTARRYTLRGVPGDDFPPLPQPQEGSPSYVLEVAVLKELMDKTHFSVSTDETRAHLNSALFEWQGETVRMVTTDGHRLSKMEIKVPGKNATTSMLIPLKAVNELRRLCDETLAESAGSDKAPTVSITESGSNAFFQTGGVTFSVKLVEAKFPPYAQVIPQGADKIVKAPRMGLQDALRAVSIASSERTGGVKVAVAKGAMKITSESPESGEGFDELPVDYNGPALAIGFNAKYFLDVLAALTDDEVELGLSGELDPAVVRPAGASKKEGRDFLAVVMPMRI